MNIPAIIGYPIRALFLLGFLAFVAVGSAIALVWDGGEWFVRQVRG